MLKKCKSIKVEIKLISNYQGVSIEHYDVDVFLQFYLHQTKLNTVVCKTIDSFLQGVLVILNFWEFGQYFSQQKRKFKMEDNVVKAELF